MDAKLGNIRVGSEHFRLELHHHEKDATHILSIVNGAEGQIDGKDVCGVLVDIDSIRRVDEPDTKKFIDKLEDGPESLMESKKANFFSCLTEKTIEQMGPTYE